VTGLEKQSLKEKLAHVDYAGAMLLVSPIRSCAPFVPLFTHQPHHIH
jgi:hypothetical protein